MPTRKLIVAGCGPHFRERYLSVLQERSDQIEIVLVVDLEAAEPSVRSAFFEASSQPRAFVFLPDNWRIQPDLSKLRATLDKLTGVADADSIMICTEPKAHKVFALWALEHGLAIFMDKPVSAFRCLQDAENLNLDFDELESAREHTTTRFVLSCERRMHLGYRYVEDFLERFMTRYRIPITSVNVNFGGGKWILPFEFPILENHPFKYGYGVLLHSGYHYIDLLARLASFNKAIFDFDLMHPQVNVQAIYPGDLMRMIDSDTYAHILPGTEISERTRELKYAEFTNYGELDLSIQGCYRAFGKHVMGFSAQLVETSVSARSAPIDPPDTGRMRQESVHIHLGHFSSITVTTNSFGKLIDDDEPEEFNITIATNPVMSDERAVTRLNRRDLSSMHMSVPLKAKLNKLSRQSQLNAFLDGGDARSDLGSHRYTIALLAEIYRQILRSRDEN
jgi:predicted dehydrogenase